MYFIIYFVKINIFYVIGIFKSGQGQRKYIKVMGVTIRFLKMVYRFIKAKSNKILFFKNSIWVNLKSFV